MLKKKGLLVICILIIVLAAIGIYMWNKPHRDINREIAIKIEAPQLFETYSANEELANQQYLNKVLEVNGIVASVETNQDGFPLIILSTDDLMAGIACTMADKALNVQQGQQVSVKGICTGLVSDVKLTACTIVE